jgi:hypothetical protein
MTLTIGIPLGIEKQGLLFTFIAYTKSIFFYKKNLAIEQCSSSQGYIVKPIKGVK